MQDPLDSCIQEDLSTIMKIVDRGCTYAVAEDTKFARDEI